MIDLSRVSGNTVFLVLLPLTILTAIDWRFSLFAWVALLGWYVSIRTIASKSSDFLSQPVYLSAASISFLSVPVLAIIGIVVGPSKAELLAERYETFIIPVMLVAIIFALHSAWMAAKALVIAEESGPADRAVRWERTVRTFFAVYFWPLGVWSVQRRIQSVQRRAI